MGVCSRMNASKLGGTLGNSRKGNGCIGETGEDDDGDGSTDG